MHTHNDTRTRDNTLALYGVKRRTPAYRAIRATVRTLIVAVPLVGVYAWALVPA